VIFAVLDFYLHTTWVYRH